MATNPPSDNLPLAEVLQAANGLTETGLMEDWALGGALAAIYYVEPFTTYDADIFFIPKDAGLTAGIPAIFARLQAQGWQVEREHLLIRGFPVQFLAASGLTEEAVRKAERIEYEGVPAWDAPRTRRALNNFSIRPISIKLSWRTCSKSIN